MLVVRRFGEGPPVVALHGFTLTGAQFEAVELGPFQVVAPDLPGHGESPHASPDVDDVLTMVAETINAEADGAPVLGYSQGGRLALALAAQGRIDPTALVLVSATAGIEDDEQRRDRRSADADLADRIVQHGVRRFVDDWTASGLTSTERLGEEERNRDRSVRLTNSADGLATALIGYGQGAMPSVWDKLDRVSVPTLAITGAQDTVYTGIGARLADAIGSSAEHVTITDAGHNPFIAQPAAAAAIVSGFLRQVGSIGSGDPDDQS